MPIDGDQYWANYMHTRMYMEYCCCQAPSTSIASTSGLPASITPNNKLSAFQHWHQLLSQLQQPFIASFGPNEAEPHRTSIHLCNGQADLQANQLINIDMQGS